MNCPKCGYAVEPGYLYCPQCREAVEGNTARPRSPKTQPLQPQPYGYDFAPQQSWQQTVTPVPAGVHTDYAPQTGQTDFPVWEQPAALKPTAALQPLTGFGIRKPEMQGYDPQLAAPVNNGFGVQGNQEYPQSYAPQSYPQQPAAPVTPGFGVQGNQEYPQSYAPQSYPQQPAAPVTPGFGVQGNQEYPQSYAPQSYPQQPAAPVNTGFGVQENQAYSQSYAPQSYPQQPAAPVNTGFGVQGNQEPPRQPAPHQATAQDYAYQGQRMQTSSPVSEMLSELPRVFRTCFSDPGEMLRTLVTRGDVITGPIVLAITLVLVFLGGMAAMRGVVSIIFRLITSLTGISLANSTAALRQGINYVAGQIAPSVGGIAVLCQLIAIFVPVVVILVYLYLAHRLPINWVMALEMVTVSTMPTIPVALLGMLASMISPVLAAFAMVLGNVIAYLQLGHMLDTILGGTDVQQLKAKMICIPVAVLITLALIFLLGGNLSGNVFVHMISLLRNMGTAA